MSSLSSLMKRFQVVTREIVEREAELAAIQRQIIGAATGPRKRKPSAQIDTRRVPNGVQAVVRVLRDAGKPLQRHEIAAALGINGSNTGWRLKQALKMGFVESLGGGRYAVVASVPEM